MRQIYENSIDEFKEREFRHLVNPMYVECILDNEGEHCWLGDGIVHF